jgi:hypothetical protein
LPPVTHRFRCAHCYRRGYEYADDLDHLRKYPAFKIDCDLSNAHHDPRCIYDTGTGRPVAIVLRRGNAPKGKEGRGQLRRIVRRWPP